MAAESRFSLRLTREQVEQYYRGNTGYVQVKDQAGREIRFPINRIKQYLTRDGIAGHYRKLHLFVNEKDIFEPGDLGLPVFDRPYGRVGMQVCFDWAFPEAWRVLALKGADVICHPANLVLPGLAQSALPIYALTNRVFIATANRVGTEGELTFTGTSLIADPGGRVLSQAPPGRMRKE